MIHPAADRWRKGIEDLKDRHLYRSLRTAQTAPSSEIRIENRDFINFASNNYLDLASDERLKKAAREAMEQWGAGATASRLLGGTLELHDRLERAIAAYKRTEASAVFPSGYHVNTGLLPALLGSEDVIILDRLAHASLVDGARLSKARLLVFRHNDPADLEKILRRLPAAKEAWVVTESVFSMDGDVAPLTELVDVCEKFGAHTYVDEAHATGVWGPEGRGVVNAHGLERRVDVCMGTLSKALGSAGGFACGNRELIEWIQNKCRSFTYSTALPPSCAAAALAALEICLGEPARREKAFFLASRLRESFALMFDQGYSNISNRPQGPIVPLIVGTEESALALAKSTWDDGIFAPAIRPPTVPKGTCRLRFSVTAGHTEAHIDRAVESVKRCLVR